MTCNVTELRHHLAWFDDEIEVYCQTEQASARCEIVRLEDHDGKPVLIIRRMPVQPPAGGAA